MGAETNPASPSAPLYTCSASLDPYRCSTCRNFQTNLLRRLKNHITEDHSPQTEFTVSYECKHCNFQTYSKYLNAQHTQFDCIPPQHDLILKCNDCDYQTPRNADLSRHILRKHTDPQKIQWFSCDKCPSKFKVRDDLRAHQCKHLDPETSANWNCELCKFSSVYKASLRKHVRDMHQDSTKIQLYQCSLCSFQSKHKTSVDRHEQQHKITGAGVKEPRFKVLVDGKRYPCDECPSKFRVKDHLIKHKKWIHAAPGSQEWLQSERCRLTTIDCSSV